jgi:tetratricopeptide (TPR) repeat protein
MLGGLLKSLLGFGNASVDLPAGVAAYERGDLETARRLIASALKADSRSAAGWLYAGLVDAGAGRHRDALASFERAAALEPGRADIHRHAAEAAYSGNETAAARRHCERALDIDPDLAPCQSLLARIELPGPGYLEVLAGIHDALRPRTYLEVGIYRGESFVLARPGTRAIGIDPKPRVTAALPDGFTVHATTSEDYFAAHDVKAELGGLPIDLAFIDGLHYFEYALRDFINVEKHCAPESTILLHDCYPLSRRTAERVNWSGFSSGDVWRLILALKKYRPGLRLHTIATPPTGLGIARELDPESRVLEQNFDRIVAEFAAVDYGVLEADKAGLLNRAPNDAAAVRALLARAA